MDALPMEEGGGGACPDSPPGVQGAYSCILRVCWFAGLPLFEAEDVAQDVFLWLLQRGPLLAVPALPWLAAVAQNFVRRYRREKALRRARESRAAVESAVLLRGREVETFEIRRTLDQIESRLPKVEARLLHLVRRGYSLAEGARRLGIPKGSHTFFRNRLIEHVTERFHHAPLRRQSGSRSSRKAGRR